MVISKGGTTPALEYVTGIFNQNIVLFQNESINMMINEILIWDTPSPYSGNTAGEMLSSYQANTGFFNGDLSILTNYVTFSGGVAAGLSGICNPNPDKSKCFAPFNPNNDFWSVFLSCHEIGHLLGSQHTHSCVWNGNGTSIDACGSQGNSPCPGPDPPFPPDGGTIMSYCTPGYGWWINLEEGFGPQPGNVIRNSVNAAGNCLTSCDQPTSYCSSNGVNTSTEYIDKVVLNSINNLSGNNGGYGDFTSLSTSLLAGNTYTISLKPKFTGGNNTKYWRVWIDYNQDFDWYDPGECIAQGTGNNTINLTFTVPSNAPASTTRMRVSMKLAGYPSFCGSFPAGEVEDYIVNVTAVTPTCSDGMQNQGEEGIDCGGPCPACPTCSDGIQNQNETGIDCGGPCPACPVGDSTVLLASYFETGWDSWIDGGPDVARVSGSNAWEGQYAIELADNSGAQSAMTTPVFDLSTAVGLQINFHFKAISMESGEDFWVQYKSGSGAWTTIGSLASGTDFTNGSFYSVIMTVPNFVPTSAGSFRIQCDASDNNDQVFIDAVIIVKLNGTEFIESSVTIQELQKPVVILEESLQTDEGSLLAYYPNPTNGMLNLELSSPASENTFVQILSLTGQSLLTRRTEIGKIMQQIDVYDLPQGLYLLKVLSEKGVVSVIKFVKQ
jgi:hypothetical protein